MTAERAQRVLRCAALWLAVLCAARAEGAPLACPKPPPSTQSRAQAEAAYRREPTSGGLYALALWACQEGDLAAFVDLLRRAVDQTPQPDPSQEQLFHAAWATRAAGVDLTVQVGRKGDALVVDGRLLAVLPLTQPLWLSAGTHSLVLERGGQRRAEIACPLDTRKRFYTLQEDRSGLSCSNPLTVLLVASGGRAGVVTDAARRSLQRDYLPLTARDVGGLEDAPAVETTAGPADGREGEAAAPCDGDECALRGARAADLSFLLTLRERAGAAWLVTLWDVALRDVGGTWTLECAGCSDAELSRRLQRQLPDFVLTATSRGRGELLVASPPAGSRVLLDGILRGETPLRVQVYAGTRVLRVAAPSYQSLEQRIDIPVQGLARVEAPLVPEGGAVKGAASGAPPRQRWRLWTGAAALVGGGALAGIGIWGWAIAGGTFQDACPSVRTSSCWYQYDSGPIGIGLTAGGAALMLGGALLLALPTSRRQDESIGRPR